MPLSSPPSEFKIMCRNLVRSDVSSVAELVQMALMDIDATRAAVIRSFMDQTILGADPDAVKEWWCKTPSSLVFHSSEGLMNFLRAIRAELDQPRFQAQK